MKYGCHQISAASLVVKIKYINLLCGAVEKHLHVIHGITLLTTCNTGELIGLICSLNKLCCNFNIVLSFFINDGSCFT